MLRKPVLIAGMSAALVGLLSASALAGERNEVLVRQESPNGTANGNLLSIDQALASDSLVTGIHANSVGSWAAWGLQVTGFNPEFATQRGEGNAATLTLTGNGGEIQLLQSANPLLPLIVGGAAGNNSATVTAGAHDLAAVVQLGARNTATMALQGGGANGLISQLGSNLNASLLVENGGTGQITQIGNNNNTGLVTVTANSNVTVTQVGNNIAPIGPTALQVISASNPGTISITQTAW